MHPLLAALAATAACALARPPDLPRHGPMLNPYVSLDEFQRERENILGNEWRSDDDPTIGHMLPGPRVPRPIDWLSEEIARLTLKEYDDYERERERERFPNQRLPYLATYDPDPRPEEAPPDPPYHLKHEYLLPPQQNEVENSKIHPEKKKLFAYTPFDKEFFAKEEIPKAPVRPKIPTIAPQEKLLKADMVFEEPRKTRQNPNLSRTKTLIAENLDKLRAGTLMVEEGPSDIPRHRLLESGGQDPSDSIYGVALIAAVGAALSVAIIGFGFGWYTLSKKAKAAADVDYPAYGVTGPTTDVTGDRKLAHSAHMYHYQHQKQQILAMERNGVDQRNGSVSDPDSEEENEEGDYTVYEWPGFATSGDMEVKNPLFTDDPTPATPCKIEVVKPQPKE